jgi:hypothetical protein
VALATTAIANLSLSDKVGIVTGVGEFSSRCVGNTGNVSTGTIPSLCLNDGPAGVRAVKNVTGFPPGINAASTWVSFDSNAVVHNSPFRTLGLADGSYERVVKPWQKNLEGME